MLSDVERIPVGEFSIEDVPAGSKRRLELTIDHLPDGQHLAFPTVVARGAGPGKTLLVCGAVHGDEYEGTIAIQDVYDELDPATLRGVFVGVPVTNTPAFAAARRETPWDGMNLARVFPGSPTGSPTERIAHAFREHLLRRADLLLDVHSGGNVYAIRHLAGYHLRDGEVGRIQREAAIAFGSDLVWGTAGLPGRTLSAAGELGIPAIYVEMPGEGRCRPEHLKRAKAGIHGVLAYLGLVDGDYPTVQPPYVVETTILGAGHLQVDHPSPTAGIFVPAVGLWDAVETGQPLGSIRHPDGRVLATVHAARTGRVLLLRTLPRVFAGETVAFVLGVSEGAG